MDPWHGFLYTVIDVQLIPFVILIEAEYKMNLLHLSAIIHSVQRKKLMRISNSDTHLHTSYFPTSKQHHDSMWYIINNVWLFPFFCHSQRSESFFIWIYSAIYCMSMVGRTKIWKVYITIYIWIYMALTPKQSCSLSTKNKLYYPHDCKIFFSDRRCTQ